MRIVVLITSLVVHCLIFTIKAQVPELWGMAGSPINNDTVGIIFKIRGDGSGFANLHYFQNATGIDPRGKFSTFNNSEKLYGTTNGGGVTNDGVLFRFDTLTDIYTDLFDFNFDSTIGRNPNNILLLASDGKFYGVTGQRINGNPGSVFSFDPSNNSLSIIDSNARISSDFIQGSNGLLYTFGSGLSGLPAIISLDIITHIFDTLYTFPINTTMGGIGSGQYTLLQATNGLLYGVVNSDAPLYGYIYSFDLNTNTLTDLIDFNNNDTLGFSPQCGLIQATNGLIYGVTPVGGKKSGGVIFSLDPITAIYHKLYDFNGISGIGGYEPLASLMQASDGKLYGMADHGGANQLGLGTIFSYDITTNTYTDIHNFTTPNGQTPQTDLIEMIPCAMPVLIISGNTNICIGDSILLTANGANHYFWAQNNSFDSLVTVSPTVTTTYHILGSNKSCFILDSIIVTVNQNPTPTITGDSVFCSGTNLSLNVGSFASYNWNNGATIQTITVDSASTFIVTVTNANGCTGTSSRTVIMNQSPSPSLNNDTSFCTGKSLVLNAGTFPQYLWSNGATTQMINVTTANTYIVTVTAANGCTGTASDTITLLPIPSPTIIGDTIFCTGDSATLNAGSFAQYLWSNGNTTQSIIVTTANTYTITVTNSSGCTGTASEIITLIPPPTVSASFVADTLSGCNPLTANFTNNSINGTSYLWNFGDSITATTMNATHIYNDSGTFTITLIATNNSPCGVVKDTFTQQSLIRVDEPIKVISNFLAEPLTGCSPLVVNFTNSSINGAYYYWFFGDGGFDSVKNPVHIYDSGSYHVYLIAYNNTNRCFNAPDSTGLLITVENCELSIPNTFTPNGDGKNDFFDIIADGYTNFHLIIYDRWGLKVFESSDTSYQWDGKVNNTGSYCPDGTYYYIFMADDANNAAFMNHGFITLMR